MTQSTLASEAVRKNTNIPGALQRSLDKVGAIALVESCDFEFEYNRHAQNDQMAKYAAARI